jgi:hypothetical protein
LSVDIKPTGNSGQLAKPVQINLQSQFRSTYLAIQVNLQSLFRSTYLANVCVDFADGGRALAGTDGGRGVEVGRVFAALAAAVQSD